MRRLLLLLPLLMLLAVPASADIQIIPIDNSAYPQTLPRSMVESGSSAEVVGDARGLTRILGDAAKLGVTLNCENDNTPAAEYTLELDQNAVFGGTVFRVPGNPSPYVMTGISLGVFDLGQTFPATLDVLIFEGAAGGGGPFESLIAFQVILDAPFGIPPAAAIIDVAIASLNIVASNDLLVLYGDANPTLGSDIVPAGDSSPRCLSNFDDVCSVVANFAQAQLSGYGVAGLPECASAINQMKLFDLVVEVTVDDVAVATERTSWGGVKARYR